MEFFRLKYVNSINIDIKFSKKSKVLWQKSGKNFMTLPFLATFIVNIM